MTENRKLRETNQTDYTSLPTPLFDANASASAQPVEPIRSTRISNLNQRLRAVSSRINGQSRMLVAVIIIGLITGALAGMLLVNSARKGQPETVAELPVDAPATEIPVSKSQELDTFAAALGASEVQSTVTRNRRPRSRVRTSRPRAYRVAVIR